MGESIRSHENLIIKSGSPYPLGATIEQEGVCFSIFSRNASRVWLLLFDKPTDALPTHEIELKKNKFKTGDIWHIHIKGLKEGQLYLYRIDGEYNPKEGHRFNPNVYILDPYAKALTGNAKNDFKKAGAYNKIDEPLKSPESMPKCVVVNNEFDWEGDRHLSIPLKDTIIYETHIRGFTNHKSSNVTHKGTYQGFIEKIPYLKELDITAVELLPIHQFDDSVNRRHDPITGELLKDYWGYNTLLFFAPHTAYSYTEEDLLNEERFPFDKPVTDFKAMVKELHRNGIEIILDVVFNHTAEGNEAGPTYLFRGIDNTIYYILNEDKSKYLNYSGCGNTVNCNHPVVRNLIMDSLHYWVNHMHVDGFRFDLASILGRDRNGKLMENAPLLETIAEDPLLRDIKIIAEAWDAGGAYQVGGFQDRWGEWNGKYRDDIRQYWLGKGNTESKLATRIAGSSDLYKHSDRTPLHSINFITSHDGFTMNDLVSYNKKHNWVNGELNRDGSDYDFSYNHGEEGETEDNQINHIRVRQIKNLLTTLFLSQGVPMLLGGDEFRRTQKGNNNAYCQDNKISWFDWSLLKENKDIFEFTKQLIAFRKKHPAFRREHFFTGKRVKGDTIPDISWFSINGKEKDWKEHSDVLGVLISGNKYSIHEGLSEEENRRKTNLLYNEEKLGESDNNAFIIFNSSMDDLSFNIPELPNKELWYRVIDTSIIGNRCICLSVNKGKQIAGSYELKSKSVAVLMSEV